MNRRDGIICQYCGMELRPYSQEYIDKHMARCRMSASLHFYSGNGPGRPSKEQRKKARKIWERIMEEMNEKD